MNSSASNNSTESISKSGTWEGDGTIQKSTANLYCCRQKLAALMGEKQKWLNAQRKASLLVQPCKTDELGVMSKFASLFCTVATAQLPVEQHQAQLALIEQIIQESIIIEWPKILHDKCPDVDTGFDGVEVDFAPLIHRARNVVKCRTSHPTMRVRVCAISEPDTDKAHPQVMEAFFRAMLVKLSGTTGERQIAGRLILTQREGTPATKYHDQSAAIVNTNGKLLASQAAPECSSNVLLEQYGETAKTTSFKYEHGTLCAIFPELGVTLNSMVDRRQLSTRYAIQVDVALNIENKLIVKHVVLSHEFLIAITNDQTESLLNFIFWPRLLDGEQYPDQSNDHGDVMSNGNSKSNVPWGILKKALKYFVKAQYSSARALDLDELLHIQCMLFYPRIKKVNEEEYDQLEKSLFGDVKDAGDERGDMKLMNRLLTDLVVDDVLVTKNELMLNKCISLADGTTQLCHNLWQWFYRATEMIIDVGHKFCPATSSIDKKCAKAKKQAVLVSECQSMLTLFNNRILTLRSTRSITKIFKTIEENDKKSGTLTNAIYMRFCDENVGHISFAFSNLSKGGGGKPLMGSLSSEQIKDFKQGIAEVLMDEAFLKHYDQIVQLQIDRSCTAETADNEFIIATPLKTAIFEDYNTMRLQNNCVEIRDDETIRINPLTGERLIYTDHYTNFSTSSQVQNPETESLSSFVHSCMQLLLHASSVFDKTSAGDSNSDNGSDHTAPELSPKSYNNTEDVTKIKTDRVEDASSPHASSIATTRNSVNALKRKQDEVQEYKNDALGALDLTKKVKRNSC